MNKNNDELDIFLGDLKKENPKRYIIEDTKLEIIKNLILEREKQGLSVSDIALKTGISIAEVKKLETYGEYPSLDSYIRYINILGADISILYKYNNYKENKEICNRCLDYIDNSKIYSSCMHCGSITCTECYVEHGDEFSCDCRERLDIKKFISKNVGIKDLKLNLINDLYIIVATKDDIIVRNKYIIVVRSGSESIKVNYFEIESVEYAN